MPNLTRRMMLGFSCLAPLAKATLITPYSWQHTITQWCTEVDGDTRVSKVTVTGLRSDGNTVTVTGQRQTWETMQDTEARTRNRLDGYLLP